MRINKLLSNYGYCSRTEASAWIEEGRIIVDGMPCIQGQWVEPEQMILVDQRPIVPLERQYLKYNKPAGVLSTMDGNVHSIDQVLNLPFYAFPIGRLDKDSEGLLLLTNDGDLAKALIAEDNHCEKVYEVKVDCEVTDWFITKMASGIKIDLETTKACQVSQLDDRTFRIVLKQGRKRQIRKMCTALGYRVQTLKRVSFGPITLKDLASGSWVKLDDAEIQALKKYIK